METETKLNTFASIGETISISNLPHGRFASIEFKNAFVSMKKIDSLLGMPPKWAEHFFFDNSNVPRSFGETMENWTFAAGGREWIISGSIDTCPSGGVLLLSGATMKNTSFSISECGAMFSGVIDWRLHEFSDSGFLQTLGRTCKADLELTHNTYRLKRKQ